MPYLGTNDSHLSNTSLTKSPYPQNLSSTLGGPNASYQLAPLQLHRDDPVQLKKPSSKFSLKQPGAPPMYQASTSGSNTYLNTQEDIPLAQSSSKTMIIKDVYLNQAIEKYK